MADRARARRLAATGAVPALLLVGAAVAFGDPVASTGLVVERIPSPLPPTVAVVVETPAVRVHEVGSYETGFWENDDNHTFWEIPNVLGVEPRD